MKTLYIHMGMPKTATSSLQSFLKKNRKLLAQKGYQFPLFPFRYREKTNARNGMFLVEEVVGEDGKPIADQMRDFRQGMDTVASLFQNYDNVILTDEGIWFKTFTRRKDLWQNLKEEGEKHVYTVKVIVYLRRQDEFISSWRNQLIKMNQGKFRAQTWETYCTSKNSVLQLDYYKKLRGIEDILGRDNLLIRCFNRAEFQGGSIYSDFMHVLGLPLTDEYTIPQDMVNLSISGNIQEFKRLINQIPGISIAENNAMQAILCQCAEITEANHPTGMFSQEEAREFLKKYEESNQKILERYFAGSGKTELFSNRFKDIPKWEKDNPHVMDDMVVLMGCMYLQLYQMIQKNQKSAAPAPQEVSPAKSSLRSTLKAIGKKK